MLFIIIVSHVRACVCVTCFYVHSPDGQRELLLTPETLRRAKPNPGVFPFVKVRERKLLSAVVAARCRERRRHFELNGLFKYDGQRVGCMLSRSANSLPLRPILMPRFCRVQLLPFPAPSRYNDDMHIFSSQNKQLRVATPPVRLCSAQQRIPFPATTSISVSAF